MLLYVCIGTHAIVRVTLYIYACCVISKRLAQETRAIDIAPVRRLQQSSSTRV